MTAAAPEPGRFPESFLAEIRRRTSLADLIGRDLRLERTGHEHKAPCPFHNEKTPSFYVVEKKGLWHCFGCGANGDCFAWLTRYHELDFRVAVEELAREAGLLPPEPGKPARAPKPPVERPTAAQLAEDDAREVERARTLWHETRDGNGSLVEAWLAARGILAGEIGGVPPSLRFAPELPYWVRRKTGKFERIGAWPAMVAAIQGADRRITGVHITYLSADGTAKAPIPPHPDDGAKLPRRKVRGSKAGGSIRFSPAARTLVLGEGVETVLSARFIRPDLAAWSAVDLGNLAGAGRRDGARQAHPERPGVILPEREPDPERPGLVLPDAVEEVILLGEAVNGDPHAYACLFERACRRFARQGKRVRAGIPPVGDFNDWLMHCLGRAA